MLFRVFCGAPKLRSFRQITGRNSDRRTGIFKRKLQTLRTNIMTLTQFVSIEERKHMGATGVFTQLLNSIQTSVKVVDVAVRKAGLGHLYGTEGTMKSGQRVDLNKLANELFINLLSSSQSVACMVSELNEDVIPISPGNAGRYIVCYDPVDGTMNIGCLASIGSIFGIYRKEHDEPPSMKDVLVPGQKLVAAGYALYGSATIIVFTTGNGVHGFMLDHAIGEFLLTDAKMRIPQKGDIYSVNEGFTSGLSNALNKYLQAKKDPNKGRPYEQRYIGSMVADIHRTIKYGGIYIQPATKDAPQGRLHLLYKCNPMAFVMEQAGGIATDGKNRILDIVPNDIHQMSQVYCGSVEDMKELESYLKGG